MAGDLVCVSGFSLLGLTRDPLLAWLDGLAGDVVVVLGPGAAFADLEPDLQSRLLARTAVWTSNAEEAEQLTGCVDPEESVVAVSARQAPGTVTVIRDGPRGCHVRVDGRTHALPGYPQDPVDTNGAGDTHTGVLAAEVSRGTDWVTAARRANAAGALKVTRRGPATAPTATEIDAFLAGQDH